MEYNRVNKWSSESYYHFSNPDNTTEPIEEAGAALVVDMIGAGNDVPTKERKGTPHCSSGGESEC